MAQDITKDSGKDVVNEGGNNAPRSKAKPGREDRLKAALKANMGRRKAQARARTAASTDAGDDNNHDHADKSADA